MGGVYDLITTHPNADVDGLASMVAARHLYEQPLLAFSGGTTAVVQALLSDLIPLEVLTPRQVDLAKIARVVLCDINGPDRAGHFAKLAATLPLHIYDHHPLPDQQPAPQQLTYAPLGATTTLMVEQLQMQQITISPWEATLMVMGIYEETAHLTYATTTVRDVQAVAWLLEQKADLGRVQQALEHAMTAPQVALLNSLTQTVEVRYHGGYKVALATAHVDHYVTDVADLASHLLKMPPPADGTADHHTTDSAPLDGLVVLVAMAGKIVLVARGNQPLLALHQLAARFGGGGHPTAAAATLKDTTLTDATEQVWAALSLQLSERQTAAQVMSSHPVTLNPDATVEAAETCLTRYGIDTLLVTEGDTLRGLLHRDTIHKALFHQLGHLPVAEIMEAEPATATPTTPLTDLQAEMVPYGIRLMPIVDGTRLVGCITRTDLLKAMHRDLQVDAALTAPHSHNILRQLQQRLPGPVLDLLKEIGQQAEAQQTGVYLVGGMVRDLLWSGPQGAPHDHLIDSPDVDLVVEGDAIAFAQGWAGRHKAHLHTHERFGTATVDLTNATALPEGLAKGLTLDFATARTEFYAHPAALPEVENSSLKRDLHRRDFTFNALAVALHGPDFGRLIDYFGGERDLTAGRIRVLHTLSFAEDPTRALRAVRFAVRFGFTIGEHTQRLMRAAGKMGLYQRLSGKRLRTELIYLLSEHDPAEGILQLGRFGVLAGIDPQLGDGSDLPALLRRVAEALAWYRLQAVPDPLENWQVYLLALSGVLPPAERPALWQRLDLPGRLQKQWLPWRNLPQQAARCLLRDPSHHQADDPAADPLTVYDCLHGAPPAVLVHLMAADDTEPVRRAVALYLSELAQVRVELNGHDLAGMGVAVGPDCGAWLKRLLAARIRGEVHSRADEINWLKQRLNNAST